MAGDSSGLSTGEVRALTMSINQLGAQMHAATQPSGLGVGMLHMPSLSSVGETSSNDIDADWRPSASQFAILTRMVDDSSMSSEPV